MIANGPKYGYNLMILDRSGLSDIEVVKGVEIETKILISRKRISGHCSFAVLWDMGSVRALNRLTVMEIKVNYESV